jgi:uncharacterized protein (DUF1015 family)
MLAKKTLKVPRNIALLRGQVECLPFASERKEYVIMAEIAPFRGLRYNLQKVPKLADVVIPPYDVISPAEQELFHNKSPYNMIHLELGRSTQEDSDQNNPHTRAAEHLRNWQAQNVLVRDTEPSIYFYQLDYSLAQEEERTRYGFISVLKLEDFKSGGVRPHEKTFQAVKDERLGLMLSAHANLSPVFALYSDPEQVVDQTLMLGRNADPIFSFTDRNGMEHRMWRVTNPDVLMRVRGLMKDKALFIADGHHRYETALNYRNIQRNRFSNASPHASFEYIMIYLSNLNQDGLTILPTHRLLKQLNSWDPEVFLDKAEAFFDIKRYKAIESERSRWCDELSAGQVWKETVIGFCAKNFDAYYLLKAKREAVSRYIADLGKSEALQKLDVVVLDQVILRHLMGLSESFLAEAQNIQFKHDFSEALSGVQSGYYDAGFFINPTRIEQVQEVANAGLVMPHKSTYFYPKVGSGMVIHPLSHDEEIIW